MRQSRKIERLYDTSIFDRMSNQKDTLIAKADSLKAQGMQDSSGGLILARNLEFVLPTIYEQPVANMTFMNLGIGVDNSGKLKDLITKLQKAYTGNFTRGNDKTANKGRISVELTEDKIKNFDFVTSMGWSKRDLERAQQNQNFNLVTEFLNATRNIYIQEIDERGYLGLTDSNGNLEVAGLLNNSVFTSTPAGDTIDNLTDEQVYELFRSEITTQHSEVDNMEQYMANKIATTREVLNRVNSSDYKDFTDKSIAQKLKEDLGVTFMSSFRCNDVGGSSATSIFSDNDASMQMRIPDPLNFSDVVQISPDQWEQKAYYECAGLDIIQEKTGRIVTGL